MDDTIMKWPKNDEKHMCEGFYYKKEPYLKNYLRILIQGQFPLLQSHVFFTPKIVTKMIKL